MSMVVGKSNWQPRAGEHCMPQHEPPPGSICSGELCDLWLLENSRLGHCDSEHAHLSHYWFTDGPILSCPGRPYCSPRFFGEPS